jgi:hypothetical protein
VLRYGLRFVTWQVYYATKFHSGLHYTSLTAYLTGKR